MAPRAIFRAQLIGDGRRERVNSSDVALVLSAPEPERRNALQMCEPEPCDPAIDLGETGIRWCGCAFRPHYASVNVATAPARAVLEENRAKLAAQIDLVFAAIV